jgi:hypothetical protein
MKVNGLCISSNLQCCFRPLVFVVVLQNDRVILILFESASRRLRTLQLPALDPPGVKGARPAPQAVMAVAVAVAK